MNVVDSSGWLEFFADAAGAENFADPITDTGNLIVPSICLYEVFNRVLQQRGQDMALQVVALMKQGRVISLDEMLALQAAKLGHEYQLPLADSVILATAWHYVAVLWTQDSDFQNLPGVRYFPKS